MELKINDGTVVTAVKWTVGGVLSAVVIIVFLVLFFQSNKGIDVKHENTLEVKAK